MLTYIRDLWISVTVFNFLVHFVTSNSHHVATELGNITGTIEEVLLYNKNGNYSTFQYVQYLGVPYAEPPIGDLRFRKPVRKTPWSVPHNGSFYRPMCIQIQMLTELFAVKDAEKSEDCLTLDIYAPIGSTKGGGPYPVLIYLIGNTGGSQGYVGDALSTYGDVIVVVINERTDLLGYFSTGDAIALGNFGLWDEKMALHWVYDHIENFKGDRNRITMAGSSMGGSNAILQAMHPDNQGIIKRVIALGGTPFPTHKNSNFVKKPNGLQFVELVGCPSFSSQETVDCLRKKTLSDLIEGLKSLRYSLSFTPVVDDDFVIAEPHTILTSKSTDTKFAQANEAFGAVDLMLGLSNMEGGVHIVLMWSNILSQDPHTFAVNNTEFAESVVPTAMNILFGGDVPEPIVQNAVYQYSDLKHPDNAEKRRQNVVDLSTDIDVAAPILKTAKFHSNISSKRTYLYQLSAGLSIDMLKPTWLEGANHCSEVNFMFGLSQRFVDAWTHTFGLKPTLKEEMTSQKIMTLISNFVKSGNPNTPVDLEPSDDEWLPFNDVTSPYLDMSHDHMSANQFFREPHMTFWTKVVPSLLQMVTEAEAEDQPTCDCQPEGLDSSMWFNLNARVAENVILALTIMSGCILIAFVIICSLSIARQNTAEYNVKTANKMWFEK